MTPEMRRIAEDYQRRLRRCLRGVAPQVVEEVEREIQAHIDDALAARQSSGTVGDLLDVLDRLGPPEDYARDLGLYLMVDRGYREWSLPYMVRSTAFWAISTVAGAVVVPVFGVSYLLAGWLVLAGLQRIALPEVAMPMPQVLPGWPGWVLVGLGLAGAALLTLVVRWFIGQYVASARPHVLGGPPADPGWARRTSRRILVLAGTGFGISAVAGLSSGVYRFAPPYRVRLPDDFLASPMSALSLAGLVVLLLSPMLGLLWTALAEGRSTAPGGARETHS